MRYATTGEVALRNVQPLFADFEFGGLAICHNGNLTNSYHLRRQLVRRGSLFQSTSDTEVIVHLIATSLKDSVVERLVDALRQVEGAYSLVALSQEAVIGVRDPLGVRPLVLGRLGDAWILASETCALDIIGAEFVRDVEPGEIVIVGAGRRAQRQAVRPREKPRLLHLRIHLFRPARQRRRRHQRLRGAQAHRRELARESHGRRRHRHAGAGFRACRRRSATPPNAGIAVRARHHPQPLCRPHLHRADRPDPPSRRARSSTTPTAPISRASASILVDDSIVRGTTSTKIVEMVRHAGAREVHMRISSPPTTHPCFYGIATPEREQLLAARMSSRARWPSFIGADSLAFISIDGLYRAMGEAGRDARRRNSATPASPATIRSALADDDAGKVSTQLSLLADTV